jgi:hypothetical protein
MTIRALTYGGIQIGNFGPPTAHYTWDGVHLQLDGSTQTADGWKRAGISIDMSCADAMDLVLTLMDAVQKHSDYEARLIPNFAKRLNKKLERKK